MKMIKGICTALVSPFRNGVVDLDTFRSLCQRQLDSGIHGLVPCGTTGETPALTHEEWSSLVRTAVEVSAGSVPVIAGCGSNSTAKTVESIKEAKNLGADAALVVFPYYNKPNLEGHRRHVQAACAAGLPVVLYHVPGRTGQRLSADLLEELCRMEGVVGLKEATGDATLGQELINRLEDTDVSILSGDDFTYAALTTMGFDGAISVLSNPAPQLSCAWFAAAQAGDISTLRSLRSKLLPVASQICLVAAQCSR